MKKFILLSFLLSTILAGTIEAQTLISAEELAAIYKNPEVLVVSTRSPKEYATLHITKAVNLYHKDLYKDGDISGLIKDADALYALLGDRGITPDKTIVLYDENSGKYASRVFWILDYLGYPNVKILDGQLDAWKTGRNPVTATPSNGKKTVVTLSPDASKSVSMAELQGKLNNPDVILVDARPDVQFNGSEGTYDPKGHIQGAINLHFEDVVNKGKFVNKEKMISILAAKNITPDKEIILYCNTGIFAAVLYVAIKYVAGFPNVKVYDGGIAEWVTVPANQIEK